MLQPEHAGLDVITPITRRAVKHVADPVAVDEIGPVAPGEPPDEFGDVEPQGLELPRLGVDGHHVRIGQAVLQVARQQVGQLLVVERQHVQIETGDFSRPPTTNMFPASFPTPIIIR